ncbi:MAG: protein kinase, partial [Lysinibacillus sp.]
MLHFFKEKHLDQATYRYFEPNTIQRIGEGSYGVAYVRQNGEITTVIKRLKAKRLNKRTIAKFQQEISFLQQLQALPVPKLVQTNWIEDAPFYEMSYINGFTFEQAIFDQNIQYSNAEIFQYTKQLLSILIKMHEANIVHRDLRIPNILVNDGQLTIIDFGLASKIDPNIALHSIKNPKKVKHPISDLYEVGHFMLFLLYSTYEPHSRKNSSW